MPRTARKEYSPRGEPNNLCQYPIANVSGIHWNIAHSAKGAGPNSTAVRANGSTVFPLCAGVAANFMRQSIVWPRCVDSGLPLSCHGDSEARPRKYNHSRVTETGGAYHRRLWSVLIRSTNVWMLAARSTLSVMHDAQPMISVSADTTEEAP